jgi:hypothetical protein
MVCPLAPEPLRLPGSFCVFCASAAAGIDMAAAAINAMKVLFISFLQKQRLLGKRAHGLIVAEGRSL